MLPPGRTLGFGEDFFVADFGYEEYLDILRYPCRIDGYMAAFCIGGELVVSVNLSDYRISPGMLLFNLPGNIVHISLAEGADVSDLKFVVAAVSADFMSSLKMDVRRVFSKGNSIMRNPCMKLTPGEIEVAYDYLNLADRILAKDFMFRKDCIASLVSSIFYFAGSVLERMGEYSVHEPASRGRKIYDDFMDLLSEHHIEEHNVGFYASELCLTPKYLSGVIRGISGRSASEWIDAYLVLESKNMLRFTEMPVKEIVDRLNFSNQSVFCKFFRIHTGMTPGEYRRSGKNSC